jgi:hypothetical protein
VGNVLPSAAMNDSIEVLRLRARLARGTRSRKAVAPEIGVNWHWLTKFEQGKLRNPTADNLLKMQAWLGQQKAAA